MAAVWVVLYSSSLLILFGQNILRILWRHLVWKVSSFCMILCGKCILKYTSNRTRMLLFSSSLTFGQSDVNICFTCIFSLLHMIYKGPMNMMVYMPQIFWSLFGVYFCLLHLTMFQDSFLICLTFGVKCKIWQAIDLVLMSSSYQYWEMSLDYRTFCLCSLCLCHFISFRVFDSLFHSCTKKSICACMSLCVKP